MKRGVLDGEEKGGGTSAAGSCVSAPRSMRSRFESLERNLASRFGYAMRAGASCCAAARPREEMLSRQQNVSKEWSRVVYNNTSSAGPHADVQELVAPLHRAVQLLELRPETHVDPFHRRAAHVPDA